jgi:cation transport regulator ChaC
MAEIGVKQVQDGPQDGLVAYFGYGSLVNRATHRTAIVSSVPARLRGWRRCWRPRPDMPGFPAALLSIREEEGAVCDGLLVIDRAENLATVDAREARYRRVAITSAQLELSQQALPEGCPAFVYVAEENIPAHREPAKILRSYLDAVLQGFLAVHGEEGVRKFIAETHGFDTPLHDDRLEPVYPRAVTLSEAERTTFDRHLAALG